MALRTTPHAATPAPEGRGRIFLLSPASLGGARGKRLLAGAAGGPCSERLQQGEAVPLAEIYVAISTLYFRGKLEYAQSFWHRAEGGPGVLVITPSRGLLEASRPVSLTDVRRFAATAIDPGEPRYLDALLESAEALRGSLSDACEVVLLGSIASTKYVEPLLGVFGARLLVPKAFIGRGDMSRGGLLLRAVAAGQELEYIPVVGAPRRGRRPPRLDAATPAGGRRASAARGSVDPVP
jgi:hypothetical protein